MRRGFDKLPEPRVMRGDSTETLATHIKTRLSGLEEVRQQWLDRAYDVAKFIAPDKGFFPRHGERRNYKPLDHSKIMSSDPKVALQRLGAGMQAGMNSPASKWFRLWLQDPDLSKFAPVRLWLDKLEAVHYRVLGNTNWYQASHLADIEQALFGQTCMIGMPDHQKIIRFSVRPAGEYCVANDPKGQVNTLYRKYPMTSTQMAEFFGVKALPDTVRNQLTNKPYANHNVIHVIEPNPKYKPGGMSSAVMKYRSIYMTETDSHLLRIGGFQEFPAFVPRWEDPGVHDYASGPCYDLLPDIKELYKVSALRVAGVDKQVNPPLTAPSGWERIIDLTPGAINPVSSNQQNDQIKPLLDVRFDLASPTQIIEEKKNQIRMALYTDLFLMLIDNPQMTATEVRERAREKMFQLGPVIESQETEKYDPAINMTMKQIFRRGLAPPPPQEVLEYAVDPETGELDYRIEYMGALPQAQRAADSSRTGEWLQTVGGAAQMNPEVLDVVNFDEVVRTDHENRGVQARTLRSEEEVAQIRKSRAEAQAQEKEKMERLQILSEGIDKAKVLSETDTETKNALTDALGAAGLIEAIEPKDEAA